MNLSSLAKSLRSLADAIEAPSDGPVPVRLLTYVEVAERLGVDESQARKLGKAQFWPEVRLRGNVRVRETDLESAIKAHVVKGKRIA